jgi:hypothetical protein
MAVNEMGEEAASEAASGGRLRKRGTPLGGRDIVGGSGDPTSPFLDMNDPEVRVITKEVSEGTLGYVV